MLLSFFKIPAAKTISYLKFKWVIIRSTVFDTCSFCCCWKKRLCLKQLINDHFKELHWEKRELCCECFSNSICCVETGAWPIQTVTMICRLAPLVGVFLNSLLYWRTWMTCSWCTNALHKPLQTFSDCSVAGEKKKKTDITLRSRSHWCGGWGRRRCNCTGRKQDPEAEEKYLLVPHAEERRTSRTCPLFGIKFIHWLKDSHLVSVKCLKSFAKLLQQRVWLRLLVLQLYFWFITLISNVFNRNSISGTWKPSSRTNCRTN